jgi:hypothetical protein
MRLGNLLSRTTLFKISEVFMRRSFLLAGLILSSSASLMATDYTLLATSTTERGVIMVSQSLRSPSTVEIR